MDNQKFVAERLEELRVAKNLTFADLIKSLQMNRYTLKKLFSGEIESTRDKALLRALIEHMGVSEDHFYKRAPVDRNVDTLPLPVAAGFRVPVYGEIPAGNPLFVEGRSETDEYVDAPPGLRNRKAYALRVKGQSMFPRFLPGDLVFFEPLDIRMGVKDASKPVPRLTFERLNGRVVAALVNQEATLKQLKILGSADKDYELELRPFNQEFKPMRILPEDTVHIQGVAVTTLRYENGEIC